MGARGTASDPEDGHRAFCAEGLARSCSLRALRAAVRAQRALRAGAAPPGGTIAYVLTDLHWAIYESTDGKRECPQGYNEGNREQFKTLFPEDGRTRTLLDTQLRREVDGWYPTTAEEAFTFHGGSGPHCLRH